MDGQREPCIESRRARVDRDDGALAHAAARAAGDHRAVLGAVTAGVIGVIGVVAGRSGVLAVRPAVPEGARRRPWRRGAAHARRREERRELRDERERQGDEADDSGHGRRIATLVGELKGSQDYDTDLERNLRSWRA